ncbi:hypothetical protein Tco_1487295, partial [Tanacetum coccineum]
LQTLAVMWSIIICFPTLLATALSPSTLQASIVDIYALINHYQTAKEIWDHAKELIEGTKLTKQERESMLYDEFDKFTSDPGESIYSYYLRFAKLINDVTTGNF